MQLGASIPRAKQSWGPVHLFQGSCKQLQHSLTNAFAILLQDMQRPLYMQPKDAIEYGIIDGIVKPQTDIIDDVMNAEQWDKQAGLVAR